MRPFNEKKQGDMKHKHQDECPPEPNAFSQIPTDSDCKHNHAQTNTNRPPHVFLVQVHEQKEHGQQNEPNNDSGIVGTLFRCMLGQYFVPVPAIRCRISRCYSLNHQLARTGNCTH